MSTLINDENGRPMQLLRMSTVQNVTVSGASAQSAAFGEKTQAVRLIATTRCYVLFGSNPTATNSNSALLEIGIPEYFAVAPGAKLAAIQATAGGALNVVEMV